MDLDKLHVGGGACFWILKSLALLIEIEVRCLHAMACGIRNVFNHHGRNNFSPTDARTGAGRTVSLHLMLNRLKMRWCDISMPINLNENRMTARHAK